MMLYSRRVWLFAAVVLLLAGCSESKQPEDRGPSAKSVAIAEVRPMRLQETVPGIGTIEALENVRLAAEIAGRVAGIHFTEGDRVEAGQLLFTLDDAELQQALAARRAALEEARAKLAQARRELARRRELLPDNLVSRENVDRAETAVKTAAASIDRLQAEIGRQKAMLEDTRIEAPVAGRVGDRRVDVGDFVDAGQLLTTLVNTERLKLVFTIPERVGGRAAVGQQVEVHVDAHPDRTFSGEVYFISPSVSPDTRSLLIQAYVDDDLDLLRPGNFAAVDLVTGVREEALVIPEEALVPTRGGYRVFVVEDGKAHLREVQIGLRQPGLAEITAGLEAGDRIVRRGQIALADGDPVKPVDNAAGTESGS